MKETTQEVYGYRWVVLLVYCIIQAIMQTLWISFAPITGEAAGFYQVTPFQIGFLAMSFMIVYILVSFPASWTIDTFGIRKGVGFGVILTGIFGLTRGLFGSNYNFVLFSTIGLAVAQPFILNSITSLSARWFPLEQRATAAGLAVMAQFIGIVIGMAATPFLTIKFSIPGMLNIYGAAAVVGAICFFLFIKPAPPKPIGDVSDREFFLKGLKHIFKIRVMIILIIIFFIGLGLFNAITTWIEQMIAPRGFNIIQAGALGAVLMVSGIVGCLIVPPLSDKYRQRKVFIVICIIFSAPGLIGLTFATSYWLLLVSGIVLGFFLLSAAPVIFQYAAEVSFPSPEATSQGVLMLSGQISGIIFIFGMDYFRTESGSMTPFLIFLIGLSLVNILLSFMLTESKLMNEKAESGKIKGKD
jgi:MFS family permease